jgi:hypothetical protein
LIGDELYSQITTLTTEERKITVIFRDNANVDDYPTKFKTRLDELAFCQMNKDHQLPLLTISIKLRIEIYFIVDSIVNTDRFIIRTGSDNCLNTSLWQHNGTVPDGDKYKIYFKIDGLEYSRIKRKENILKIDGVEMEVFEAEDLFRNDINNLPA